MKELESYDVISGRGGATNNQNRRFRELVQEKKKYYAMANKMEKKFLAKEIVATIREKGGRFLKRLDNGELIDIGDLAAMDKTCQALREGLSVRAKKREYLSSQHHVTSVKKHASHQPPYTSYSSPSKNYFYQSHVTFQNPNYTYMTPYHSSPAYHFRNDVYKFEHPHYENYGSQRTSIYSYAHSPNRYPSTSTQPSKSYEFIGKCTCKKSFCLKLYCQCFSNSSYCSAECQCQNCGNNPSNSNAINEARDKISKKNCFAFQKEFTAGTLDSLPSSAASSPARMNYHI